jgi:PPK2 family polyphosphate:nucleotide phosphotransferase
VIEPIRSQYLVPFDGDFKLEKQASSPGDDAPKKKECEARIEERVKEIQKLQGKLYADDRYSVLLIFQAMDAAGKDGTVRAVMTGINPAGCQVYSFKQPSAEELDHDFLWRTTKSLPERGRIGIFNRSYYEEVLVMRVHPEWLGNQKIPGVDTSGKVSDKFWEQRYESIRDHERHLARNGTLILKFFLNVSKDEQKKRFLERIEEAKSNWKFSLGDIAERQHWNKYMKAYEQAMRETSRPWAPWYAIPADNKPYMRMIVCEILAQRLESLELTYPQVSKERLAQLAEIKKRLEADD